MENLPDSIRRPAETMLRHLARLQELDARQQAGHTVDPLEIWQVSFRAAEAARDLSREALLEAARLNAAGVDALPDEL